MAELVVPHAFDGLFDAPENPEDADWTPAQRLLLETFWRSTDIGKLTPADAASTDACHVPLVPAVLVVRVCQCEAGDVWRHAARVQRWAHVKAAAGPQPGAALGSVSFWRAAQGWGAGPPAGAVAVQSRGITIAALYKLFLYTGYWEFDTETRIRDVVPQLVAWSLDYRCSAAELLASLPLPAPLPALVKPPDLFVSYCWGMRWHEVTAALLMVPGFDPKASSVWVDIVCINQHTDRTAAELQGLEQAIISCGTTVVLIDDVASALNRIWCLFEILVTVRSGNTLTTMFTATAAYTDTVMFALLALAGRFQGAVDIEHKATATFERDRCCILKQIRSQIGLEEANAMIEAALVAGARAFLQGSAPRGLVRRPRLDASKQAHSTGFTPPELQEMLDKVHEVGVHNVVDKHGRRNEAAWESVAKVVRGSLGTIYTA